MKKLTVFAVLLTYAALMSHPAGADPVVSGFAMTPSDNIWIGESPSFEANCSDDQNNTIEDVTLNVLGDNGYTLPDQTMTYTDGSYSATIDSLYLGSPNSFTATVYCINNESVQSSDSMQFTLSDFSVGINAVEPSIVYVGGQFEVDVDVISDGNDITSGVTFDVEIDGQTKYPIINPPYDPTKGWVIYLESPSSTGTHQVEVTANYGRAAGIGSAEIEVADAVQFSISNIDKTSTKSGDTITLEVEAMEEGSPITIDTSNINVVVGSSTAAIKSVTAVSNYYKVEFTAPSMGSGDHVVTVTLDHQGSSYTDTRSIEYTVPVSGSITDHDGGAISTQIKFLQGNVEKFSINTDSEGHYSGDISPREYDVEFRFPDATVKILGLDIDEFDDPIEYYSVPASNVGGIASAGLHVVEVSMPYNKVTMGLHYDESRVSDESKLKVYKCSSWSKSKLSCNSKWKEISANIDTSRNIANVEVSSLSAFMIGTINGLRTDIDLSGSGYPLKSTIDLGGIVTDDLTRTVSDASVTISIEGTGISKTVTSDSNGIFSINIETPSKEGEYTISVSIEKDPYTGYLAEKKIKITKSQSLSIIFPDTVKVDKGSEVTQILKLVNGGHSDLNDMRVTIDGLPDSYVSMSQLISIPAGSERNVEIVFSVPEDAGASTSSAKVTVSSDEVLKEKVFGFTITVPIPDDAVLETDTQTSPATGLLTGISVPATSQLLTTSAYILIFALSAFTMSFAMKKRKKSRGSHGDVKFKLFQIKGRMDTHGEHNKHGDSKIFGKISQAGFTWGGRSEKKTMWEENKDNKQPKTKDSLSKKDARKGTYYSEGSKKVKNKRRPKDGKNN